MNKFMRESGLGGLRRKKDRKKYTLKPIAKGPGSSRPVSAGRFPDSDAGNKKSEFCVLGGKLRQPARRSPRLFPCPFFSRAIPLIPSLGRAGNPGCCQPLPLPWENMPPPRKTPFFWAAFMVRFTSITMGPFKAIRTPALSPAEISSSLSPSKAMTQGGEVKRGQFIGADEANVLDADSAHDSGSNRGRELIFAGADGDVHGPGFVRLQGGQKPADGRTGRCCPDGPGSKRAV